MIRINQRNTTADIRQVTFGAEHTRNDRDLREPRTKLVAPHPDLADCLGRYAYHADGFRLEPIDCFDDLRTQQI